MMLVLVLSLCLFTVSCAKQESTDALHKEHMTIENENLKLSGRVEGGVRVVEVKASRYKFEPDPIVVGIGEHVRLLVTSTDVEHGMAIPEFDVKKTVPPGKTETIEFDANKKGAFHAHCSTYCGPGHAQMHATLIVK